jgi:hypothetical protein
MLERIAREGEHTTGLHKGSILKLSPFGYVVARLPEGAGNSVRPFGAGVGRIAECASHASIGCFGT